MSKNIYKDEKVVFSLWQEALNNKATKEKLNYYLGDFLHNKLSGRTTDFQGRNVNLYSYTQQKQIFIDLFKNYYHKYGTEFVVCNDNYIQDVSDDVNPNSILFLHTILCLEREKLIKIVSIHDGYNAEAMWPQENVFLPWNEVLILLTDSFVNKYINSIYTKKGIFSINGNNIVISTYGTKTNQTKLLELFATDPYKTWTVYDIREAWNEPTRTFASIDQLVRKINRKSVKDLNKELIEKIEGSEAFRFDTYFL